LRVDDESKEGGEAELTWDSDSDESEESEEEELDPSSLVDLPEPSDAFN